MNMFSKRTYHKQFFTPHNKCANFALLVSKIHSQIGLVFRVWLSTCSCASQKWKASSAAAKAAKGAWSPLAALHFSTLSSTRFKSVFRPLSFASVSCSSWGFPNGSCVEVFVEEKKSGIYGGSKLPGSLLLLFLTGSLQ